MFALSEYPAQIEGAINEIGTIQADIAHTKAAMDLIQIEVDRAIAFEEDFNPLQQRAEREHRLGNNPNYYNLIYRLNEAERTRIQAIARLERLKTEFVVVALDYRAQKPRRDRKAQGSEAAI